jgi:hypothetical protein
MGVKLGLSHYGTNTNIGCIKNRVLRRIFVLKKDEVKGGSRKLHIEEFHN